MIVQSIGKQQVKQVSIPNMYPIRQGLYLTHDVRPDATARQTALIVFLYMCGINDSIH